MGNLWVIGVFAFLLGCAILIPFEWGGRFEKKEGKLYNLLFCFGLLLIILSIPTCVAGNHQYREQEIKKYNEDAANWLNKIKNMKNPIEQEKQKKIYNCHYGHLEHKPLSITIDGYKYKCKL
jgi:hypothetical protein